MSLITGTVIWFNSAKGFGFIRHDAGETFVHYSAITSDGYKNLKEGQIVEFELAAGANGRQQAEKVRVVAGSTSPH